MFRYLNYILLPVHFFSLFVAVRGQCKLPPAPTNVTVSQFISKTYNYVIVGGGTAGLVLANRYRLRMLAHEISQTLTV